MAFLNVAQLTSKDNIPADEIYSNSGLHDLKRYLMLMIYFSFDETVDNWALAYSTISEKDDLVFDAIETAAQLRFMHYN